MIDDTGVPMSPGTMNKNATSYKQGTGLAIPHGASAFK
jgi:hypothetical protein